jgi:hypothetical protein
VRKVHWCLLAVLCSATVFVAILVTRDLAEKGQRGLYVAGAYIAGAMIGVICDRLVSRGR